MDERIIACEQAKHRLVLLDVSAQWDGSDLPVLWQWSGETSKAIPGEHRQWFTYPDEAKPVLEGTHVLATFSGGAVALIRVKDADVVFYTNVGGNPHSADLLPDGSTVTASSEGGYLRLHRKVDAEMRVTQIPMHDAHGVVWDGLRQCIWANGGRDLKQFGYAAGELTEVASYPLPGGTPDKAPGGHDLAFDAKRERLLLTTNAGVFTFDPISERFAPYESLAGVGGVKSIDEQRPAGRVLVMRATENWWSDTLQFSGKPKRMPGARFYKARWWPSDQ